MQVQQNEHMSIFICDWWTGIVSRIFINVLENKAEKKTNYCVIYAATILQIWNRSNSIVTCYLYLN